MNYDFKKIGNTFQKEIENQRILKKEVVEFLKLSRTTLDTYLEKGEMPLSIFIKLCELLKLEPSTFFLENTGTMNNAVNSPNATQSIANSEKEKDLLKEEIKFLREKIDWLEKKSKD